MAITYQELAIQITNYSRKSSTDTTFTTMIPYFVNMGMERIYREAQDIGTHKIANISFSTGNNSVSKPANWSKTIAFYYGTTGNAEVKKTMLFERSYEFCQAWLVDDAIIQAPPQFYADHPDNPYGTFFIAPAPDQNYLAKLVYVSLPPYLTVESNSVVDNGVDASWVCQRAPSLIFYAAYLEALTYMGKTEDIPAFENLYNRALQSVNLQTKQRSVDRTADREQI
jgi:hypothetical protein